ERDGLRLRHALEVRHPSFDTPAFYELAAKYGAAIVYAEDDEAPDWPRIDQPTAEFTYARLMSSREDEPTGLNGNELDAIARLGGPRRGVRLLHLRGQGAQSGRGHGADRPAGLRRGAGPEQPLGSSHEPDRQSLRRLRRRLAAGALELRAPGAGTGRRGHRDP